MPTPRPFRPWDPPTPVAAAGGTVVKVTSLNMNGLRACERRGFRRWLAGSRPDVLCLQEIRCDEASAPARLWRPRGWRAGWTPSTTKGYSGTAVWVSQARDAAFSTGTGHPRGDAEGRVTGISVAGVRVFSVYMPSGSSGPARQAWKYEYMAHVEEWLARMLSDNIPTLVCGDLNVAHREIDLKNWRANRDHSGFLPDERAWMDRLVAAGWRDAFRERHPARVAYSWWSNRGQARAKDVGWRIDYVLASPSVRLLAADIEPFQTLSDHAPVSAWIELP